MKRILFLIVALITFSCAKHEDAKMWVQTENCKTLSFQGENGTVYNLNATDDTNFYFVAKTSEKINFSSSPVNPNFPFKFDVFQNIDGTDVQIIHINSQTNGEFKTEK